MQSELNTDQQIHQVELTIEEARGLLALGEAIEKLEKNPDFQKVIFETYFVEEAARNVSLLAEPAMQQPHHQKRIKQQMRAISEFKQFLLCQKRLCEQARIDLADNQDLLDHLRGHGPTDADNEEV